MAVDTSSAVARYLDAWRSSVNASHATSVDRMLGRRWGHALHGIDGQIAGLLQQIEARERAGQPTPVSWLHQRDRLVTLRRELDRQLRAFAKDAHKVMREQQGRPPGGDALTSLFGKLSSVGGGTADLSAGLGTIGPRNAQALNSAIALSAPGGPVQQLMERVAARSADDVVDRLVLGVAAGENPRVLAKALEPLVDAPRWRTLMIARTETMRAWREATADDFRRHQHLLQGWVWLSAADKRTCPACWARHGSVHPADEVMGSHPNCRCAMAPLPHGYSPRQLGITDGELAFSRLPEADRRAIMGASRFDAYQQGLFRFGDMATPTFHPTWGAGVRATPLRQLAPGYRRAAPTSVARQLQQAEAPQPPLAPVERPGEWQDVTTVDEVNAQLARVFPNATIGMEPDQRGVREMVGIDEDALMRNLNGVGRGLTRMARDYPEAAGRLRYVGTYVDEAKARAARVPERTIRTKLQGSYAHASRDGERVAFDGYALNHPAEAASNYALRHSIRKGWLVETDANPWEQTALHEYGHQVNNWLDETLPNRIGAGFLEDAIRGLLRKRRGREKYVSSYAQTKPRENWAESFAALEAGYTGAPGRAMVEFVRAVRDTVVPLVREGRLDEARAALSAAVR